MGKEHGRKAGGDKGKKLITRKKNWYKRQRFKIDHSLLDFDGHFH